MKGVNYIFCEYYFTTVQETTEERRRLVFDQDRAYEESLQIDQAKVCVLDVVECDGYCMYIRP